MHDSGTLAEAGVQSGSVVEAAHRYHPACFCLTEMLFGTPVNFIQSGKNHHFFSGGVVEVVRADADFLASLPREEADFTCYCLSSDFGCYHLDYQLRNPPFITYGINSNFVFLSLSRSTPSS